MTPLAKLAGPPLPPLCAPTINAALARAAATDQGLTLVDAREHETFVSYAELRVSARRIAAALHARGLEPGDRVAIVLPTGRDFLDAFFGALLAGAVPVPLYPPVRLGRMDEYVRATARMLTAVQAKIVLSDRRVKLLLGAALELARPPRGCPTVAELRDSKQELEIAVTGDSLGLIQFSSGSTVDPKAVALSHHNLVAQCAALKSLLGAGQRGVTWLPLYHDMGLIGCLLSAVYFPGSLVMIPPELFLARPALWLRAISRHRATVSPAPNFAYGLCLKRVRDDELEGVDLSHWQFALNGAEPVSSEVLSRFAARFARWGFCRDALMPVYGLAEASLAVTFTPSSGAKRVLAVDAKALAATGRVTGGSRAIASVGTPVPGAEIEIRSEEGAVLNEGETGRIHARGPFVMTGYFGDADATARTLKGGWLDTGDLGFIDGGELFICGRARELVIIRGANHAPHEFEEGLEAIVGVRTGCVVAVGFVPEEGEGEELLLLVEATAEALDALPERIAAAVLARTGIRPHTVRLLAPGTLPRTSSGKLRRGEALRRFLAGTLNGPASVNPLTITRVLAKSALGYAKARLG